MALSNLLQNIKKENKQIIIAGDFNYDLLSYTKNERINEFVEIMYENLCQPCIIQQTRVVDVITNKWLFWGFEKNPK